MPNDPFTILGISSSATEDEIKAAYRKLAKKYHPDLNPGDKSAEQKMREINEAYTRALQIKKTGRDPYQGPYGNSSSSGPSGYYGNPFSQGFGNNAGSQGGSGQSGYGQNGGQGSNPFGDFGFDPFSAFFGGSSGNRQAGFRTRTYSSPDLQTVQSHVLACRFHDAVSLLNRIPNHDADWHALYARADYGLGNRISALDHARTAVRMSPGDSDFQDLLNSIEAGRQAYRQTRSTGYDFRSALCANPCLTCCLANMVLNCCLGGCGRYGLFC